MRLGQSGAFQSPLVACIRKSKLVFRREALEFLGVSVDQHRTFFLEPFLSFGEG